MEPLRRRGGERHSRRRRRRWFSWETKERERRKISSRGEVAGLKAPFSSSDARQDRGGFCRGAARPRESRRIYESEFATANPISFSRSFAAFSYRNSNGCPLMSVDQDALGSRFSLELIGTDRLKLALARVSFSNLIASQFARFGQYREINFQVNQKINRNIDDQLIET